MRRVHQHLRGALERPDHATARVLSSLVQAERAVRGAPEADPPGTSSLLPSMGPAPADRAAAQAAILERLQQAGAGRAPVDEALLDGAEELTSVWAQAFLVLPAAVLVDPVRAHVNRLTALLDASLTPAARARLGSLIGDVAAFAGCLTFHLDRPGEARAWYALARDAARDAGDATLQACALEGLASLFSTASTAGQGGDARVARALAQQANAAVPEDAPGTIRAWLAFREAVEHAAAGDAIASHRSIDRAETALAQGRSELLRRRGFLSEEGRFRMCLHPSFSAAQRGWSLMQLSSPAALPLLRRTSQEADPALRGGAQAELAELYARRDDREEACRYAIAALETAQGFRYPHGVHIVRTLRRLMEDWDDLPERRDLDERLAAA